MTAPGNRGINHSLMCIISINGVVAWEMKTGAWKAEDFIHFIETHLIPYFAIYPTKILIMDNANIHKTSNVLRILNNNKIIYKFLVDYSPETNPIENFFSMIKLKFYVQGQRDNNLSIGDVVSIMIQQENYREHCIRFYHHMREWLEKARRKEQFI